MENRSRMTSVVALTETIPMQGPYIDSEESREAMPPVAQAGSVPARKKSKAVAKSLRDRIVLDHLPLVKAIAVRVHENLPVHVDLDDLIHAGILGLFDAATKYDPEKKVIFHSYAKHRIKGAILDSLRQLDWASRDLRRRHKQVEAATRDLSAKFERPPTEAEIAEKMGVEVERWRQMVVELRTVGLISASGRGNERDNDGHGEQAALARHARIQAAGAVRCR